MAFSRFGASKYRNAVPSIPHRDEWVRGSLPPSSSSTTSSSVSTFSSEIKTSREWIVTITASGDLSYRGYEDGLGAMKVGSGGGVGDWDLSRLEGGILVVGGLNGQVDVYTLPSPSATPAQPSLIHTIPPSSSPVTTLALHPTTPDILLVSTFSTPASIYDLSSSSESPSITLNAKEPKGIWSLAWNHDGRLIAGVGRSGTGYVWDPRKSSDPIATKPLSIQALKPARVAWVGDNIFLTSFSKTRSRQYSLLSGTSLDTAFTQGLDTNPGTLLPLVDKQRKIIYTAGRGDMTLRQIELSGPQGYQETLHPLGFPLASASLALVHPAELEVMKAEIARVLVPVVDKDGDTLLPLGMNVPRRQLIDYHDDLYPDISGTVAEQTAREWLDGSDKIPLPISLDPSRRGAWEAQVAKLSAERQANPSSTTAPSQPSTSTTPAPAPAEPSPAPTTTASTASPTPAPTSTAAAQPKAPEPSPTPAVAPSTPKAKVDPNLPALVGDETYASTSYKARIISDHLAAQIAEHKSKGEKGPLMVGLQGPQGCGKTTLTTALVSYLEEEKKIKSAILSVDDLYKTHDGLQSVAQQHPDNALLAGRGPPGTHDVALAVSILEAVETINSASGNTVNLPIFDKSLCGGEGDRSKETVKVTGPIDLFILEGWSMGFAPLSESELKAAYANPKPASPATSKTYFPNHPLSSLSTLNFYLTDFASAVYPFFSSFIQVEPVSYDYVFAWRLEQERAMKAKNGGKGMSDEQVEKFVERYMPGYELWKEGIWKEGAPWSGKGLRLKYGEGREIIEVGVPTPVVNGGASEKVVKPSPEPAVPAKTEAQEKAPSPAVAVTPATTAAPTPASAAVPAPAPAPVPAPTPAPVSAPSSSLPKPSATQQPPTSSERFNPQWSRKFLAAKSPLIPTYDSLPALSTLHQDSKVLKITPHLAFFPIQGTGGRLGVHPLKKKGRVAVGGEGYLSGGVEIVDFDAELGSGGRVAVAGEDGVIRVWKVSPEGIQGVGPEPDQILHGKAIDKFTQITFHPTAKDLLVGVTNDHGQAYIRFWDLASGEEASVVEIPAPGVFNTAFSPRGDQVAVATKDGRILVLDPRKSSIVSSGKAHDSPRSFQISWIDSQHLVSVGFARGSMRKILLYRLPSSPGGEITTISSVTIDVSPSVLFPVYDPDTSILHVWGKGERVIQAYEVHPENEREPIAKLPSFTAGTPQLSVGFLPKRLVDLKKVEVAKALRLTAKTLEEVSFTIPRNKPEFFQDDIYLPTVDVETPASTASEWLAGHDASPKLLDLRPQDMKPLSQAPKVETAAKKKFVPAGDIMSEEQKKKQEMDALFAKAKADESSDEDEPVRKGLDPPDDDW
ncbi:hypothetical protein IAT38_000057 [Cryptococcus sp. DSM 104549]